MRDKHAASKAPNLSPVDASGLAEALRSRIAGEIRFDDGARALYATDASNYRQVPIGVVLPRDAGDVLAAISLCREFGAPLLSRGGGTSLSGQCCNVAVVLDFSKYMNRILEIDPERRIARVQPGVVLDHLRNAAEQHHLTFGPDPASHDRCTIGGMIGNNSCGVHSVMAGKTDDNIEELEIVTYDGTHLRVGENLIELRGENAHVGAAALGRPGGLDVSGRSELSRGNSERAHQIEIALKQISETYASQIRQRFPNIPRRVSGYNLNYLLPENGFHIARALVGSEGTCATVLEATCRLVESPPQRVLLVVAYADIYQCADRIPEILAHQPIGLEGFDDLLVHYTRTKGMNSEGLALLPEGGGWLMVEFGGQTLSEAESRARNLADALRRSATPPNTRLFSGQQAKRIWEVRESSLGVTSYVPGEPMYWEGWEDSAVDPAKLGAYLRDLRKLMDEFSYKGSFYGHFGHACVHTRVNFDLQSKDGIAKFRRFMEEAADLVVGYGGSLSGEHGDGQARAELLPKMFGPELMQAFRDFKSAWDPDWKMNPGKLIGTSPAVKSDFLNSSVVIPSEAVLHAPTGLVIPSEAVLHAPTGLVIPSEAILQAERGISVFSSLAREPDRNKTSPPEIAVNKLDENLRLGPNYTAWQPLTHFQFPADQGSLSNAALRCVGVGKCRREEGGVMCPSYRVTHDEAHSTRGRAHLLWEMTQGLPHEHAREDAVIRDGWRSEEVKQSLDLCLACKGCKSDCPVGVDVATYKAEFLSHYYEGRIRPRSAYAFGNIDLWARIASAAPGLANLTTQLPFLRDIAKIIAGVAPQRTIPALAPETFKSWFSRRRQKNAAGAPLLAGFARNGDFDSDNGSLTQSLNDSIPTVLLWPDTFNNHFHPETARAALEVLEAAGFRVIIPRANLCCGRPLYDFGMLDRAQALLLNILDTLAPEIEAGIPVVGLEPSCVAVFRDELLNLFPHDQRAQALARQTYLLGDFLELHSGTAPLPQFPRKALLHGHCHHKSIMKMSAEESLLRRIGIDFTAPAPGCCGMAGSFGFESDNDKYEISAAIGELELLPAVRQAPADWLIIADGFSCREQIAQGTHRHALHLAEVLKMAIETPPMSSPSDSESSRTDYAPSTAATTPCHSDRSRSASDGAVEEPAVSQHCHEAGPYPESSVVSQRQAEVRASVTRAALGLGALATGTLLLRQLFRNR